VGIFTPGADFAHQTVRPAIKPNQSQSNRIKPMIPFMKVI
jgi:hypothetical protein